MTIKLTGSVIAALAVAAVSLSGCNNDDAVASPQADTASVAAATPSPTASTPADNGVAALSADEILKRTTAALADVKSFHAAGSGVEDGQKMAVDVKIAGKDSVGWLTVGKAKIEMLAVGGTKYIKPNEAMWAQNAGGAKQAKVIMTVVGDRWVKLSAKDKDMAGLFDLFKVDEIVKPDGKVTKGAAKQVDGVPAITLTDHGDPGGTLYIATTGEPLPLEVDGGDKSTLTFSDFGKTFAEIKKPAASDVIDLAALAGK
ncbi:hypothetical protein ACQPZX_38670 [Actinoplanes sp. CA-142083]|uniref:hypothetical protein n=1 Tax=Actinoplanes sp. CA-142083 TaxID=3239903 RepID=UPI003D8DF8D6